MQNIEENASQLIEEAELSKFRETIFTRAGI
jgi:hypothetical protein